MLASNGVSVSLVVWWMTGGGGHSLISLWKALTLLWIVLIWVWTVWNICFSVLNSLLMHMCGCFRLWALKIPWYVPFPQVRAVHYTISSPYCVTESGSRLLDFILDSEVCQLQVTRKLVPVHGYTKEKHKHVQVCVSFLNFIALVVLLQLTSVPCTAAN